MRHRKSALVMQHPAGAMREGRVQKHAGVDDSGDHILAHGSDDEV